MAQTDSAPVASAAGPTSSATPRTRVLGFALLIAVYLAFVYLVPRPVAVKPEGWRLTGLFLATIAGSILQPIPGGALVLMAVTLSSIFGGLSIQQALAGYADTTVWLVMAAFFISRALIKTGLARRIALGFVRRVRQEFAGRVATRLSLSDVVLATIIPSNGARSGGVILPIVRSISELYGSQPRRDRGRARIVSDGRRVSGDLRQRGDVLDGAGEQSARGANGRGHVRLSG